MAAPSHLTREVWHTDDRPALFKPVVRPDGPTARAMSTACNSHTRAKRSSPSTSPHAGHVSADAYHQRVHHHAVTNAAAPCAPLRGVGWVFSLSPVRGHAERPRTTTHTNTSAPAAATVNKVVAALATEVSGDAAASGCPSPECRRPDVPRTLALTRLSVHEEARTLSPAVLSGRDRGGTPSAAQRRLPPSGLSNGTGPLRRPHTHSGHEGRQRLVWPTSRLSLRPTAPAERRGLAGEGPSPPPSSSGLSPGVTAPPVRYRLTSLPQDAALVPPARTTRPATSSGDSASAAVSVVRAGTPQARYEAGMAAYHHYAARRHTQHTPDQPKNLSCPPLCGAETGAATKDVSVSPLAKATFTTTASGGQSLRFHHDTSRDDDDGGDEDAPSVREAQADAGPTVVVNTDRACPAVGGDASTRVDAADTALGGPPASSPLVGVHTRTDTARDAQAEARYLARRRIRTFENTYHTPRLHPTPTPLLDALMDRVAHDYFQQHPPPAVVRRETDPPASTNSSTISTPSMARSVGALDTPPAPSPTAREARREGHVELAGWLALKDKRLMTASGVPSEPVTAHNAAARSNTAAAKHTTKTIQSHVDRVLVALSSAHGHHNHTHAQPTSPDATELAEGDSPPYHRPGRRRGSRPSPRPRSREASSPCTQTADEDENVGSRTTSPMLLDGARRKSPTASPLPKARVPLPQRLAACLRRHQPLLDCVACTARLLVYALMRVLPVELYVGDAAQFAAAQRAQVDGLTRLLRRVEADTPHAALQRARRRVAVFSAHHGGPALTLSAVVTLCGAEWQGLTARQKAYVPVLASTDALAWLLSPDGGVPGEAAEDLDGPRRPASCEKAQIMAHNDATCRILCLLLSGRALACAALATVLEERHTTDAWRTSADRASAPGAAPPCEVNVEPPGTACDPTQTTPPDVAELVRWLRVASEHGGHLDHAARQRALHVLHGTLGDPDPDCDRSTSGEEPLASHDLFDLIAAPCSLLVLAVAVLLHVSDAPAQSNACDEGETAAQTETARATRRAPPPPPTPGPGRPRCLYPQLVALHGGYGQAPFTGEVCRHMQQKRDLVHRLHRMTVTSHNGLAPGCAGGEDGAEEAPRDGGSRGGTFSDRGDRRQSGADARGECEADRQAHYAYLRLALMPSMACLPLEGVHHILATNVATGTRVPVECAEELVGPCELALLLDLMRSFSRLSMSLSSNRSAARTDETLERKRQRHTAAHAPSESTPAVAAAAAPGHHQTEEHVDAFFFEFHRQTLLTWSAVVCAEAATSYARELAGTGLADFAFTTYDTTTALTDVQQDTIMASPLAALVLPNTLLLSDSRHLAPLVLERCRAVVLDALVQLKGEMLFLLTGVDEREKLSAVHRATLLGVRRAAEQRRVRLWSRRDGQITVKGTPAAAATADDDGEGDETGTEEADGTQRWALEAARTALAAASRVHAEHTLERIFLCCPLYARDGRREVATLAEVVLWAPTANAPLSNDADATSVPPVSPRCPPDSVVAADRSCPLHGAMGNNERETAGSSATDATADVTIPEALRLNVIQALMDTMEEDRLASNDDNTLFNGTLMNPEGTGRRFNPLGPQWHPAKSSSAHGTTTAPLFPTNTVTKATVSRPATARAAVVANAIAHRLENTADSPLLLHASQPVTKAAPGTASAALSVRVGKVDSADTATDALHELAPAPPPPALWFEVGKASGGASCRQRMPLRDTNTRQTFDLDSVSPLVALATCVQSTHTHTASPLRPSDHVPPPQPRRTRPQTADSPPSRLPAAAYRESIRGNPFMAPPTSTAGREARHRSPADANDRRGARAPQAFPRLAGASPLPITLGTTSAPTSRPGTGSASDVSATRPWSGRGRVGHPGSAAMAPVNTRPQSTRVSMRERLGYRIGEHLIPWTS